MQTFIFNLLYLITQFPVVSKLRHVEEVVIRKLGKQEAEGNNKGGSGKTGKCQEKTI